MKVKEYGKKTSFSFFTVILTALITLAAGAVTAYLFGYLSLNGVPENKNQTLGTLPAGEKTLYTCGMHPQILSEKPGNCPICGMKLVKKQIGTRRTASGGERKIAYWRAPMNPTEIYDKPGKSAMGMDLVPVYEDDISGGSDIIIDPVTQQNMGIRTAVVKKSPLMHTVYTYGNVTYDETRLARINPRFNGWIERLYIDFKGQWVKQGDPLFTIYSPELITAQQDYLEAWRNNRRHPGAGAARMLDTVRRRLLYYGIDRSEIKTIEKNNAVMQTITVRSPFNGIVVEKKAFEGDYVKAGTMIYEIADLSVVWVEAHIYEYEFPVVELGQNALITLPYIPGKQFSGRIAYIDPYIRQKTRDAVARIEIDNPDFLFKPGMYADVRIQTGSDKIGIQIPEEAVLRTGKRNIVFVVRPGNKFSPREVTLGILLDNNKIQILKGLAPGETVVTSGQFLLDSESKLQEAVAKLMAFKKRKNMELNKASEKVTAESDFFEDME